MKDRVRLRDLTHRLRMETLLRRRALAGVRGPEGASPEGVAAPDPAARESTASPVEAS